ncbi:hypothetical protein OIO90_000115 [Microbotryomycetes sp. JL221]|nr:hypothetical protein OIO90_000115 [Microbotryomycetes sp. JL221]
MSRKRTLEPKGTPILSVQAADDGSVQDSSPQSAYTHSFEFDSGRRKSSSPYARSLSTAASSPMARTASNSSFSTMASAVSSDDSDADNDGEFDDVAETEDEEEEDDGGAYRPRPRIKRRRTGPSGATPSNNRRRRAPRSKEVVAKDVPEIWPPNVEEAFQTAITLVPRLGRKKVMVRGKSLGRNELIAEYVFRKTGEVRSRKQVSSHIQVLKNINRNDPHFLWMVNEPKGDAEEDFSEEKALKFFDGPRPDCEAPPMLMSKSDRMLSPYSPVGLRRSYSTPATTARIKQTQMPSPINVAAPSPTTPGSAPMSATSSLTHAMSAMHFPSPPFNMPGFHPCPIAPASFALWADNPRSQSTHVFADMQKADMGQITDTTRFEDLPMCDLRYPMMAAMGDALPCQFLHVDVRLNIPYDDVEKALSRLHAKVVLSSVQSHALTAVTSIYSYGTQVLSLEEDLPPPRRLGQDNESQKRSRSPGSGQHVYAYDAPFACDFFSIFLRGAFSGDASEGSLAPSFAKSGDERSEFSVALSGLSVVQEFIARSENTIAGADGQTVSPGSALGDVVLVVTYDLSCSDSTSGGNCSVSRLSMPLSQADGERGSSAQVAPVSMGPPPVRQQRVVSDSHQHHHHSKPNLSLHIPPPDQFVAPQQPNGQIRPLPRRSGSSQPTTPWPQVIHTPTAPPPMHNVADSTAEQARLERAWANQSNPAWAMESPALIGAFPAAVAGNYTHAPYFAVGPQNGLMASQRVGQSQQLQSGSLGPLAIGDMTAQAMAAPSPRGNQFPIAVQQVYGAPFVIHPSHAYAPDEEEEQSHRFTNEQRRDEADRARQMATASLMTKAGTTSLKHGRSSATLKAVAPSALQRTMSMPTTATLSSAESQIKTVESGVGSKSASDYFSNLLGASKYA